MSYSVTIVRQTDEGRETPITLDEWNSYIESDPELKRPDSHHPNFNDNLVLLPAEGVDPDDWQWLWWVTGSISSDYPQPPMLKKMGQVARHFNAVVRSDDGDIWTIDENGGVSMDGY
jgi:hypothetical protein